MNQKKLAIWLKTIIGCTALIGLFTYGFAIPILIGKGYFVANYPEFSSAYVPWVVFISISAIPCFMALIRAWQIATEIGRDNSFSGINARYMRQISLYAMIDCVYFFVGNIVMLFLNMNHPGFVIVALFIVLAGIIIAVAAACLAHLIEKAAVIREENESFV